MNTTNLSATPAATTADIECWYPILPSSDLPATAEVALGFLDGEELALWRAGDGTAQAWKNRCPHRGVRFTLGRVINGRLSCAYHGWEYQAGDGRCVSIPAHPRTVVPRNICAQTYRVTEAQGMIWATRAPELATIPECATSTILRSLGVRAPLFHVVEALCRQGWHALSPNTLQGVLAGLEITAFLSAANDSLVLLHAGIGGQVDKQLLFRAHAALRRLRCELEAGWNAPGVSQ